MDWIQWREGGYSGRDGTHHSMRFDPPTFNPEDPEAVKMCCSSCRRLISERWKTEMLARSSGARRPRRLVGWHLPSMYSPAGWTSWTDIADDFLKSKDNQLSLQVWVNHQLAETYEEPGDTNDADALHQRCEEYSAEVPHGVGAIFLAADVHKDRIEVMLYGFGAGEESWALAQHVIVGDPEKGLATSGHSVVGGPGSVWAELHDFLGTKLRHESGQMVPISGGAIDAGYLSDQIYRFARAHVGQRIFATRGASQPKPSDPFIMGFSAKNAYRTRLYSLNTGAGKDIVHARLQLPRRRAPGPRPGYVHFPITDWANEEFFKQLTAEKAVGRYVKGKGAQRVWLNRRPGKRNEAWDLTVLGLAALRIRGPSFGQTLGARARALSVPSQRPAGRRRRPQRPGASGRAAGAGVAAAAGSAGGVGDRRGSSPMVSGIGPSAPA